jgi:hypothetical protein
LSEAHKKKALPKSQKKRKEKKKKAEEKKKAYLLQNWMLLCGSAAQWLVFNPSVINLILLLLDVAYYINKDIRMVSE